MEVVAVKAVMVAAVAAAAAVVTAVTVAVAAAAVTAVASWLNGKGCLSGRMKSEKELWQDSEKTG